MAYKAKVDFKDLRTNHDYKAGDIYPFEGEVDKARVEMLINPTPQRGPLIEEVVVITEKSIESTEKKKQPKKAETKKED